MLIRGFLTLLCGLLASPAWAVPAFVQGAESAGTSATTQAITFGSNTTTGNTIVCGSAFATTLNLVSAADAGGVNVYTLLTETASVTLSVSVQQFYSVNITGGWTVLTATYQNSGPSKGVHCAEFSGLNGGVDQQAGQAQDNPGTATDAVTSGNITTTAADEVLFSTTCCSAPTVILGTNYTYIDAAASFDQGSEYRIVSSIGTYAGTWTANGATHDFATRVASFKGTPPCRGALLLGVGGC
jgi:hypothetical protein